MVQAGVQLDPKRRLGYSCYQDSNDAGRGRGGEKTRNSTLVKWRFDLKKETENIFCWTGKRRNIIWLVCVPAVHGLRASMSPQFSTTTYCAVLLNQHGNPPQHCHVPCHGGSMEGSRAAQTLTLSSIDRGVLRFFSGMWITRNR